jgi:hypothetical protein
MTHDALTATPRIARPTTGARHFWIAAPDSRERQEALAQLALPGRTRQ